MIRISELRSIENFQGGAMLKKKMYVFALLLICRICAASPAAGSKVLVVMSDDVSSLWEREIKSGIESVMTNLHDIRYIYMDSKNNPGKGMQKAKEAYSLYQEFLPDGVIGVDDTAQALFVVPYLRDKVKTPVIFCGVDAELETYRYPASNVSGVLERPQNALESVSFAQEMIPAVRSFGYIANESPEAKETLKYLQSKTAKYPINFVDFKFPRTFGEAVLMTEELKERCDLLFIHAMQNMSDKYGNAVTEKEALAVLTEIFGKATATSTESNVRYGALCAVVRTGREQGEIAGEMLMKAMSGRPLTELPITVSGRGKRIVNSDVMASLGIKPAPAAVADVEWVKMEK